MTYTKIYDDYSDEEILQDIKLLAMENMANNDMKNFNKLDKSEQQRQGELMIAEMLRVGAITREEAEELAY